MPSDKPKKLKQLLSRITKPVRSIFKTGKKKKKQKNEALAVSQVTRARKAKNIPRLSQLKHLPRLLTKTEKTLLSIALVLIIGAGGFLAVRLATGERVSVPAVGGEYTEGLVGTPQLVNPLYASSSDVDTDLARLIYSGLMRYDTHDGLVTDLAEFVEVSEDQTEYTLRIRDNARWHDGEQVRAEDVIFTISAIQNRDYRSPLEISFSDVEIEQVDDKTVRFLLDEPFSPFLSLLTVGVLPSHIWSDIGPVNAPLTELNKKPVGSGPYKFEKLVRDSAGTIRSYTLKRNADFYRNDPYIEQLHFKFYPETTSAVEALKNHNIEGLGYVPADVVSDFENTGFVNVHSPALSQYVAAFFNPGNNPVLEDKNVRTALSAATDKNRLVKDALDGRANIISSFILEGMTGYHPDLETPVFDREAAAQLLEDSGWTFPQQETEASVEEESENPEAEQPEPADPAFRQKDGATLFVEVVALNAPELSKAAESLKAQWKQIGVQVNIRLIDQTSFQNNVLRNRQYDILLSGEQYGIYPDPYAFWHSSQTEYPGLNLAGLSNREADELIENARKTINKEERAQAYRQLQEIVAEDVRTIFLFQPTFSFAAASKIQHVDVPHIIEPADRFSRVNEWYIKTRRMLKRNTVDEGGNP